jgi:hypothetical protein
VHEIKYILIYQTKGITHKQIVNLNTKYRNEEKQYEGIFDKVPTEHSTGGLEM